MKTRTVSIEEKHTNLARGSDFSVWRFAASRQILAERFK